MFVQKKKNKENKRIKKHSQNNRNQIIIIKSIHNIKKCIKSTLKLKFQSVQPKILLKNNVKNCNLARSGPLASKIYKLYQKFFEINYFFCVFQLFICISCRIFLMVPITVKSVVGAPFFWGFLSMGGTAASVRFFFFH